MPHKARPILARTVVEMALESGATDLVAFAGALRRVAADRVAFVAPLETEAQMLASVTPWTASEIKAAMTDGEP